MSGTWRLARTIGLLAMASLPFLASADSIVSDDAFLPAVHITGATGRYRTDVTVFNPDGSAVADVQFYYTPSDTDGSGLNGLRLQGGLGPRESITLLDIVSTQFGYSSSAGSLEIRGSNALIVTSNTYNADGPNGGTYGQFSPGQPYRNALAFDNSFFGDLYVTGLPHDGNHRTNAVAMNPTKFPLEAGVQLIDGVGNVVGTKIVTIPPFSMTQLNDIFRTTFAGAPAGQPYRLNFFVNLSNSARILCYATVTDLRTGDPYLLVGQAMRP